MVQYHSKMEAEVFQTAVADISLVKNKKPNNFCKSGDCCMTVTTSSVVAVEINLPKCRTSIATLFGKQVYSRATSFSGDAVISHSFHRHFKDFV